MKCLVITLMLCTAALVSSQEEHQGALNNALELMKFLKSAAEADLSTYKEREDIKEQVCNLLPPHFKDLKDKYCRKNTASSG